MNKLVRFFVCIWGLIMLIVPFIPLSVLFVTPPDDYGVTSPYQRGIGILLVLGISFVFCFFMPEGFFKRAERLIHSFFNSPNRIYVPTMLAILFGVLTLVSFVANKNRPQLVDTVVQLFQAKIFAAGLLYAPLPKFPEFFITQHMLLDGEKWYGQYPPGHSALLAIGVLFGQPWLISVILAVLTAYLLYRFVSEIYDNRTAKICLFFTLICSFFLFMGPSFMNHVSTAFFSISALYCFARWEKNYSTRLAALMGVSLGGAILCRPLCAFTVIGLIGIFALPRLFDRRSIPSILTAGVSLAAVSSLLLLFNYFTTGNPLLPGYIKLWGDGHGLGFHESPWGEMHSPLKGLLMQTYNLFILSDFLFEWPLPSILPVAAAAIFGLYKTKWDYRLIAFTFAFSVTYFFYWHRDSVLGPRFLFLTVLSLIPLTVRAILLLQQYTHSKSLKLPSRTIEIDKMISTAVCTCIIAGVTVGIPPRFKNYKESLKSFKVNLADKAKSEGINSGLIFVPVSWGVRIMSEMRALGVSAHMTEKLYRRSDHCLLDAVVKDAMARKLSPTQIEAELPKAVSSLVTKYENLNDDPTLRLRPGVPLTPSCNEEIQYDGLGYTLFMPHLADEDPELKGPFVIATDLRSENKKLIELYPELKPYVYRNGQISPM